MSIPVKVNKAPIVEAVVELYFESTSPSAVLFGKLYSKFAEDFPNTETLPVLEMPEQFRESEPELRNAVHYRLHNDKFSIGIGQRIVSISRVCSKSVYNGWDEYYPVINEVIAELQNTGLVVNFNKITVRYLNLFDAEEKLPDIFNLELNFLDLSVDKLNELALSFSRVNEEGYITGIGLNTNAKITNIYEQLAGTIFHIQTFKDSVTEWKDLDKVIDKLHKYSEKAFFSALSDAKLESLEPVYE